MNHVAKRRTNHIVPKSLLCRKRSVLVRHGTANERYCPDKFQKDSNAELNFDIYVIKIY